MLFIPTIGAAIALLHPRTERHAGKRRRPKGAKLWLRGASL